MRYSGALHNNSARVSTARYRSIARVAAPLRTTTIQNTAPVKQASSSNVPDEVEEVLFTEAQLQQRVRELARCALRRERGVLGKAARRCALALNMGGPACDGGRPCYTQLNTIQCGGRATPVNFTY
jgi:hypothetical protein